MMPEPLPVWQDESFAGTLFPHARPIPTKWITTDHDPIATVEEFRAREEHRSVVRERQREYAQNPNVQYGRWHEARQQALAEMRRERRQERIAAGIEDGTVRAGEITIDLQIDLAPFAGFAAAVAKMSAAISDQILSTFAIPSPLMRAAAAEQERLAKEAASNAMLPAALRFPDSDAWAKQAVTQATEMGRKPPKSPPPRERYLPGTRHAGRGRHT
jgi:hypothetical protein